MKFFLFLFLLFGLCACKSSKLEKAPPSVSTALVQKKDVPVYIDTIGQAISPVTVEIRSQVAGKIIAAYIQLGSYVEQGQLLYLIDPRPYQAALDEAKAQLVHDQALLEYAEATVKRYTKVVEEDYISKLTFEQYVSTAKAAAAQVELDRAAVEAAAINVEFCSVVAPVEGKISYFYLDVGNIVVAYDTNAITSIHPTPPIDIVFSVSQEQFDLIRQVQGDAGIWPFVASLPEEPKKLHEGKTFFIDNQINQDTGTLLARARLPNPDRQLWPGAFMNVKVLHKVAKGALVVPPGAVLIGKNGSYVYALNKEGKAVSYDVSVITRSEEYIAIESKQIREGDTVITEGQLNVAPGMLVTVVNKTKQTQNATQNAIQL